MESVQRGADPAALLRTVVGLFDVAPVELDALDGWVGEIKQLSNELDEFGVDGRALIRFGMTARLLQPVLGFVTLSLLDDGGGALDGPKGLRSYLDVEGWNRVLNVARPSPEKRNDYLDTFFSRVVPRLVNWVYMAPFENILRRVPALPAELGGNDTSDAIQSLVSTYRWIVERSVDSDLSQWAMESLVLEFQMRAKGARPVVPPAIFGADVPGVDEVAREIASRVADRQEESGEDEWLNLTVSVQKQAVVLLRQERFLEAAALFEFLLSRRPSDAAVHNNLGFCLLPTDPVRSAEYFLRADQYGFVHRAILINNRIQAARSPLEMGALLLEAERYWVSGRDEYPVPCTLWSRTDAGWTLDAVSDARVSLAAEVIRIIGIIGRVDRLNVWRARLSELDGSGA